MIYDINEVFYSLKGEGRYTGHPMSFIRLAGCNLQCPWCDTDYTLRHRYTDDELVTLVKQNHGCDRVVITGGEPLCQDLSPLVHKLQSSGYWLHLETNGTLQIPDSDYYHWIAVSPKAPLEDLCIETLLRCDEIKFLVGDELGLGKTWFEYSELVLDLMEGRIDEHEELCLPELLLMPLADGRSIDRVNTLQAIRTCLEDPRFKFCVQLHKVLNIK